MLQKLKLPALYIEWFQHHLMLKSLIFKRWQLLFQD
ncbi:hypothetical protein CTATCC11996_12325 [Comamonas testosteroni ATCC 11996]|nr:hypothetical protein CTATCC11996_12325 [Comamonas testosteroni ATCC 11996]